MGLWHKDPMPWGLGFTDLSGFFRLGVSRLYKEFGDLGFQPKVSSKVMLSPPTEMPVHVLKP